MKKIFFILLGLCVIVSNVVHAQFVSLETARQVAENFFLSQMPLKRSISMQVLPFGNREQPTMYAFSSPDGWVLVAGDKRVLPILAYSDENSEAFPAEEDMPDGMIYLLEWYANQIEALRNENLNRVFNPQWEDYLDTNRRNTINRSVIVSPLLTRNGHENAWDQSGNNGGNSISKSYNKFCPAIYDTISSCDHAVVGCVAVATSQIMWYWQWPYAAVVKDDNANQLVRNYNWKLMPYQLTDASSLEEADMVANLLHDVGVAVNMEYGCGASSAVPDSISVQLRNTFSYYAANLKKRSDYANSTWISMIKSELDSSRPVAYGGRRKVGTKYYGHRFVMDGYDSDNKFHINFGWGGTHHAYYSIDSIYNNYHYSQSMVMNIYPNYPSCSPTTIPSTDVWPTHFLIQNGGGITIGNRTVTSGMQGVILSGEYVKLNSGFKVNAGAEVYIAIKDMHCDDDRGDALEPIEDAPEIHYTPHRESAIDESPSATKHLRNGQVFIERNGKTYTATGAEIR